MTESNDMACRVTDWIADQGLAMQGEVVLQPMAAGRSNLTFSISDSSGLRYVLRIPPEDRDHELVLREWRVLEGVSRSQVSAPAPIAFRRAQGSKDRAWFLMERLGGSPLDVKTVRRLDAAARSRLAPAAVEALAEVHSVDLDDVGLTWLRRTSSVVARQTRTLLRLLDEVESSPAKNLVVATGERMLTHFPRSPRDVLLHGDFKAENLLVDVRGEVVGVVDWELATVGDPLLDLAWLSLWWSSRSDDSIWLDPPVGREEGVAPSDDLVDLYQQATGIDTSDFERYRAFALWRLAALNLRTRSRFANGAMDDRTIDAESLSAQIEWQSQAAASMV